MYSRLTRVRCLVRPAVPVRGNEQWMLRTRRGSDASEAASSSPARFPARIGYGGACLLSLTLLLGAAPAQAQISGTPLESATLLGTTLTLTFDKSLVITDTLALAQGFTVDGILDGGSVHPSGVTMDHTTVTLELGMGAEPGQTVTVSYDPDMVPKGEDDQHRPLRYMGGTLGAGTLVPAFSAPVTILAPKPATGLSVSFVAGRTVTAVEVHGTMTSPGVTKVPDFSSYGNSRLAADATSQERQVIHGDFTFYPRPARHQLRRPGYPGRVVDE